MRIMVIGRLGFIGTNLTKYLYKKHQVSAFTGKIENKIRLKIEIEEKRPRVVINLASYGNSPYHYDNPNKIFNTNLLGVHNLLELSKLHDFKLIQAGTSSEYGIQNKPMSLRTSLNPVTDYAKTKACASILAQHGAVVLRLFTVYGEHEDKGRLIPTVINNTLNNKVSEIYEGAHDYVYVKDVCRAFEQVIDTKPGIYHVASGYQVRNWSIAMGVNEEIELKYGIRGKLKLMEGKLREYDNDTWFSDEESILPNWERKTNLSRGLTKTVKWWYEQSK